MPAKTCPELGRRGDIQCARQRGTETKTWIPAFAGKTEGEFQFQSTLVQSGICSKGETTMKKLFSFLLVFAAAIWTADSFAQSSGKNLKIAYSALSGSSFPIWIAKEARLFEKYGLSADDHAGKNAGGGHGFDRRDE